MPAGLIREGAWLIKPHVGSEATGETLARRSLALGARGLRTPELHWDAQANHHRMRWIDGTTCEADAIGASSIEEFTRLFDGILPPLRTLHVISTEGLGLEELDPLRRIIPRLPLLDGARAEWVDRVRTLVRALEVDPRLSAARGGSLVHGDFHPRQVLTPSDGSPPWLLDLVDLAIGCPESDFGNLLANVATNQPVSSSEIAPRCARAEATLARAVARHGFAPLQTELLHAHTALALVRRLLKRLERRRDATGFLEIVTIAEAFLGAC